METLFDLVNLWDHMVRLLNAETLDPSYYGVFKNILNDWLVKSHGTNLASFTHAIRLELESLSKSVALSTGLSMPLIWELASPALPSTIEQWTAYDHLVSISKMLDNNAPVTYGKKFSSSHTDR
jgi:midasin (ATPase involved in ribosome maturation)